MQNENQPLSPNQPALPPVKPFPVYEDIVNETRSRMSKAIEIAKLKPTGENIDQVAFESRRLRDDGEKFIDEQLLQAQPQFNAEQAGIIKGNFMQAHKFAMPEKDKRLPNYWGLDSTTDFLKGAFNSAASIYDGVVAATIPLVSGAFDDGSNEQVKQGADGNWMKAPMSPDLKKIKDDALAQSQYDEVLGENATPKFEYADPEGVAVLAGESIGSLAPMALAAVPVVGVPLMFSVYGGSTYGSTIVNARQEEKNRYQAAKDIGVDYESIPESTLQARALIDAGIEVGVEMVGFKIFKKIWGIGRAGRAATPAVSSATRSVAEASTRGVTGTAKKVGLSVLEEATEEGVTQGGQDVVGKATGEKAYFDNWDMAETYGRATAGGAIGGGGAGTVVGGYQTFRGANENEKEITKRLVLSVIDQNRANAQVATPDLKAHTVVGTDGFNAAVAETQDAANPRQGFVVARGDFKDISQSAMENAKRAGLKIELFGTHAVVYNDTMTSKADIDALNASTELHELDGRSRGYVPLDGARGAVVVRNADGAIVRAIPYNTNKELGLAREKASDMQITIPSVTVEEVTGTETIDRERKASVTERAPFHNSQVVGEYVPHLGEDPRALGQVVGAIAADTFKMADEVSQDARIAGADVTAVPTTTELTAAEQTESEKKVVADARKSGVAVVWVNSRVDVTNNKTGEKSVRQGSFEALSKFQTLPKTVVLVREGDGKLSGDSALNTQLVVWHELLHEFSSKNGTAAEAILALSPKETAGAYVDYFSRMNRGRFDLGDVKLLLDIASAQGVTPEKGGKIQTPDGEMVIPKAEEAMAQQAQTQLIRSGTAGRLSNMGSPSWRAGQLANNIATRFGFNGKTAQAVQSIVMQRMAGVDANRVQVASALLAEGKAKRDSIVRESEEMKAKEAATKLEASNKVAAEAEAVALNTAKSDALNVEPIEPAKKIQPKIRAEMDAIEKDIDAKDLENARIRDELVALEKQGRRTGDFGNQAQLSQQRNELAAQTREQEGRLAYLSSLDDAEQLDEINKAQNQNFAVPNVNDVADDESMTYAQRLARATLVGRERQSITPEGSLFNNSDPNASVRLENRRDFPVSLSQSARRGLDPKKLDALIAQVQELNFTEAEIEAAVIREPVKKDAPAGTLGRIYGRDDASLIPIKAAMQRFQRAVAFGVEGILWYERSAQKFLDLFDNNLVLTKMFATAVAGTSANNDVRGNQTASQKVWDQFTADVQLAGFHTKAQEDKVIKFLNEGIGWKGIKTMTFLSNITDALEEEHAKRTGKPAPKPSTRSTIDLWMTRIFFPTKKNPSAVEYKMGENFVRLLTSKLSYDGVPLIERQVQAASWVGQKGESLYEGKVAKWNEKNVGQSMDESTRQQLHDDAYDQALTDYHDTSMRGGVPWTPTKTAVTNRSLAQRKTMAQDSRTNMKVFAEVAPHPKSLFGIISEKWKSASRYALREAALRSHFVDKTHKLLGLKSAVRYTRGMGLYQGQLNHNLTISLVSTPENPLTEIELAEESELLARTLQYETYQEVNPLHKANFAARKVNGSGSGFQMNFTEELKPKHFEILKDIFVKHFGEGAGFSLMTGYQTLQCADFSSWGDAVKEKQWRKSSISAIMDIEESDELGPLIQEQRKRNDPRGTKGNTSHARYASETLGVNGYHEHDWSADAGGVSLGGWITSHARTRGSPNLQAGIDNLRSEFKNLVKKVAKNSWERDPNWTEEIASLEAAVTAAPNAKEKDKATARLAKRQLSIDTFDERKTVAYEADVKTAEAAVVKAKAKVSEKKMLATTSNTAESKDAVKEAQKGLTAAQNSLIREQEKLDEWNKEKPPTPVPPTTPTGAAPTDASPEDTTTPDTDINDMTASVRTATPETLRMGKNFKSAFFLGYDEVTPDSSLLKASNLKDFLIAGLEKEILTNTDMASEDFMERRRQLAEEDERLSSAINIPLYANIAGANGKEFGLKITNIISKINIGQNSFLPLQENETSMTTSFSIDGSYDTEGNSRSMDVVSKTFATVLHAMKLVANANKPDFIYFDGNTNAKHKLYNRLAVSFAEEVGYQILSAQGRVEEDRRFQGFGGTFLQSEESRLKDVSNNPLLLDDSSPRSIPNLIRNTFPAAIQNDNIIARREVASLRRMTVDEAMNELMTAPNQEQRQADSLGVDASVRTGVRGAKDKFLGNMVDRYNELAREQRVAESTGGYKLTSAQDPYLSVRLLTGRLGALQKSAQDRQQKMIDKLGQDGINPEQLGEFMYMQHAAERNAYIASKTGGAKDGGSGITNAEVMKYFANLNSSPTGNPVLFATLMKNADSWRALLKESLKAKLDAGLIKQDAYDAMTTTYKRYVPLRDMEGEYEQEQDQVGSRGMSSVGRGTPRTGLGRGSEAQNIVPQIQFSVLDTVKRVEKLKVGNKFLQFVYEANGQKLDGTLGRISRSYSGWENDPMNFGVFADSDLRLSPEAKAFAGGKPTAEQRRGMFEKGDLVVIRMINPELAKSMTSTTASGDLGLLDSAMEVVGRTWRLMTTGVLAPVFAVTNIARDIGGALPHTTAVQGMGVAARTAANIPLSLARVYRDNFLGNPTGIYKQFVEDGGDQMYWQPNSMDIAVDSIEKMWKKRKDGERLGRRDYERLMYSWYTGLFAASEKATRLATYKAMIDSGQGREQAALWARNVTVDFAKKGHLGQQINRWWIYSNAGIQGSANMAALATKKGGAAVIATAFAAGFASALFNRWHRDDEDEENINPWDLVSDYDKASKFVFMKEDGVMVTIPAPYGFNVPYYAGVVAADTLFGPKRDETGAIPSVVERIGVAAINSYLPIGGSGTSQSLTSALAPTVIKPFVELQFNEDYRGAAIYPKENPFDKGTKKPDALESWDSTGAEWKTAAEWLHEKTGGNEVESGGFDVHPETLRFLSGYAFSGTGRLLGQVANFAAGESTAIGMPAVSSFMKETPSSSDIRKQYEYLRNKAAQANDLINEAKSSRDPNTLVNQQNRYPWQFELASQVKASEKKLKQISGWIKDAQTPEEKKKYREAASRVMQEINEYGFDVGAPMK